MRRLRLSPAATGGGRYTLAAVCALTFEAVTAFLGRRGGRPLHTCGGVCVDI